MIGWKHRPRCMTSVTLAIVMLFLAGTVPARGSSGGDEIACRGAATLSSRDSPLVSKMSVNHIMMREPCLRNWFGKLLSF
jgi:hypothetical protein